MYFDWVHTVLPEEADWLAHASNVAFIDWLQSAAIAHSASVGWAPERYVEYGSAFMVRSHQITYLGQAKTGDTLRVRTWLEDMAKAKCLRRYEVDRLEPSPQSLARAETIWAFVDLKKGVPRRIPDEIQGHFPVRSRLPADQLAAHSQVGAHWVLSQW